MSGTPELTHPPPECRTPLDEAVDDVFDTALKHAKRLRPQPPASAEKDPHLKRVNDALNANVARNIVNRTSKKAREILARSKKTRTGGRK